jgi:hypothetical protein
MSVWFSLCQIRVANMIPLVTIYMREPDSRPNWELGVVPFGVRIGQAVEGRSVRWSFVSGLGTTLSVISVRDSSFLQSSVSSLTDRSLQVIQVVFPIHYHQPILERRLHSSHHYLGRVAGNNHSRIDCHWIIYVCLSVLQTSYRGTGVPSQWHE